MIPIRPDTPIYQMKSIDLFDLIKQAVLEAVLEANKRQSTVKADFIAKQLLGG